MISRAAALRSHPCIFPISERILSLDTTWNTAGLHIWIRITIRSKLASLMASLVAACNFAKNHSKGATSWMQSMFCKLVDDQFLSLERRPTSFACNSRWDTEGLLSIIMRRVDQHITKYISSENKVDRH